MQRHAGTLATSMIWLFAAGAAVLGVGSGYLTPSLGSKAGLVIYFLIFAAAGFGATFLTRARRGVAILAMVVAAIATAAAYYAIVGSGIGEVTTAMSTGVGADADQAAQAGGVMGIFFGIIAAIVTLADALVAGIGGCIAGARVRAHLQGA